MRGLVIFLLVIVVIASFGVAASISNHDSKIVKIQQSKKFEFSTFTSAVCENKEDAVHCRDEVFVNCDGKIGKATEIPECNNFKVDIPKATGAAVFGKDWKDPRN